ncbi:MAG TPA: hypothetical protein VI542_30930 [Candidatus Tectomicrobia bacterium]
MLTPYGTILTSAPSTITRVVVGSDTVTFEVLAVTKHITLTHAEYALAQAVVALETDQGAGNPVLAALLMQDALKEGC